MQHPDVRRNMRARSCQHAPDSPLHPPLISHPHHTTHPTPTPHRYGKFGKDPGVATSFLPDKDREREEEELRRALKKEWHASQARIKAEPLEITYRWGARV